MKNTHRNRESVGIVILFCVCTQNVNISLEMS